MRRSHLDSIYDPRNGRAKQVVRSLLAVWLLCPFGAAFAQTTHIVRLEVDPAREIYRFVPARVSARPGDVIRFRVSSGAPHNVTFDGTGLPVRAREVLNAAMPDRTGDLSGPVLDRQNAEYRIVVPQLPPGTYPFYCTAHRVYDERGQLIIGK